MKLPVLKIGNLVAQVPIIQGGMAIRLSTARLAAAVANEGGIGLIAASGMEEQELRTEIRLARKLTNGKGIIGINCMVAARAFKHLIVTAAQEGVDLIVAGAGFSRDIFAVGREYNVAVVPIVSSVKLAKISEKLGASAIVVEGTEAGGHLGTQQSIKEILPDIVKAVKIPVIGNGDITSEQIAAQRIAQSGVDGVMIGRAILGNPWLLNRICHYLQCGEILPSPTTQDIRTTLLKHLNLLVDYYGERAGVAISRKHIGWYVKSFYEAKKFREQYTKLNTLRETTDLINEYFLRIEQ